ncbi:MAG: hypothetical protein P8X66_09865 [Maritimibacter sp.]
MGYCAQEDARQTALIRQAWTDSGKVYGYCKLTQELTRHEFKRVRASGLNDPGDHSKAPNAVGR